jgi:hypothetical protein
MTKEEREENLERIKEVIETIQQNALNNTNDNCVARVLTYQQAFSIMLRSEQLIREGSMRPHRISDEEMQKQIEICHKQRYRKKPYKRVDKRRR